MNKQESFHQKLYSERLHIRAFTIWEMLIALIITGFLVSLVYLLLFRINHLVAEDYHRQNKLEDIVMFEKEIYLSFANSDLVYREDETIFFDHSYLILSDSALFYYRDEQASPEMLHIESYSTEYFRDLNIITDLELVLKFNLSDTFTLHFRKNYRRQDINKFYPNGNRPE